MWDSSSACWQETVASAVTSAARASVNLYSGLGFLVPSIFTLHLSHLSYQVHPGVSIGGFVLGAQLCITVVSWIVVPIAHCTLRSLK